MTLAKEQVDWVRELAGKGAGMQASADTQNLKDRLLQDAFRVLDSKVAEIQIGENFVMEMRNTGLTGFVRQTFKASKKTMKGIADDGDPDDSFDTGHDLKKSEGLSAEQATALTKAHSIIVGEVDKLRKERDATTNKPLFTDIEISKEIFEPLMRRKIIPENAITDQYSDVSRTFEAASSEYDTRLAAYTESVSANDGLAAKLGLGSDMIKGAGDLGGKLVDLLKVIPGMPDIPASEIKDIMLGVTMTISAPLDISAALLKDGGVNPKSIEKIAKTLVGVATAWVTTAFDIKFSDGTKQDAVNKQLGSAINAGLKIGLSSTTFAAKLAKGEVKDAVGELGDVLESCLACVGSGRAYNGNVKDDGALAETGKQLKFAMTQTQNIAAIVKALDSDDPATEVADALQNMMKSAIAFGAEAYTAQRKEELKTSSPEGGDDDGDDDEDDSGADLKELDPEEGSVGKLLKLAQTKSKAELEKLFEEDEALKGNKAAQELMLKVNAKKEKDLEEAAAQMEDEVAKDEEAFRALLSGSESQESDEEVESIEVLILQIKKDQMIIKMAEAFIKMPAAAIAAFLPPASIAVDAIQIATAMRKAAVHAIAWMEWNDNVTDAKSSMSVQVSAMANRAGISKGKAARETVVALEGAIKLVGDCLATAGGPFAPAGMGLARGVSVVSTLKDAILKVYDEAQLKRNWAKYKRALENPDDRKAIRSAIKGNATLAKYVIAYGGVVGGDPVAKNALRKCGLSMKVLQSPNTNIQKVVTYLETVYADDPVILERLDDPPRWHPGPIELTSVSIAAYSNAGQKKARPPFAAPIQPGLPRDVLTMEETRAALDDARKAWEALADGAGEEEDEETKQAHAEYVGELNAYARFTGAVIGAIDIWQPTGPDGKPHAEGLEYRKGLNRIARRVNAKAKRELAMHDDDAL